MLADVITGSPETVSDCFCPAHVMLHFPRLQKAHSSHPEIKPVSMVCVLVWLHLLSKKRKGDVTSKNLKRMAFIKIGKSKFKKMAFIKIGNSFNTEIDDAAMKERAADKKATSNQDVKNAATQAGQGMRGGVEAGSAATCGDWVGIMLDTPTMGGMEIAVERQETMSTFSSFQNHCRFGNPLPATEGATGTHKKQQKVGKNKDFCKDSLRRTGLCQTGKSAVNSLNVILSVKPMASC